jgi:hypothetical protein
MIEKKKGGGSCGEEECRSFWSGLLNRCPRGTSAHAQSGVSIYTTQPTCNVDYLSCLLFLVGEGDVNGECIYFFFLKIKFHSTLIRLFIYLFFKSKEGTDRWVTPSRGSLHSGIEILGKEKKKFTLLVGYFNVCAYHLKKKELSTEDFSKRRKREREQKKVTLTRFIWRRGREVRINRVDKFKKRL